jgi:hypothetical protein
MKNDLSQEGGRRRRRSTLILIAVGCTFLAAAVVFGVSDNPPGLLLVYLAVVVWILAFAHRWRRVRSFLILLGASLVGFALSVILHNVFYALHELAGNIVVLSQVLVFLEVAFFLLAIFVCPAGALIGAVGSAVLAVRHLIEERGSARL